MMPMAAFSDFICAAIYSKGAALGKVIISPERNALEKCRDTRNVGMIGIAIHGVAPLPLRLYLAS